MDPALFPLLLLFGTPLALFMGVFSLYQFTQIYSLLVRLGARPNQGLWRYVRPYHKQLVRGLTVVLGDHDKLLSKIQPTHVILTAILIVLIIQLERVIQRGPARRQHT